ncbi:Formylglycine-generating enzyme, required for sulfatase activity, contains SUMF1/FGE domain [Alkalispirochaeta americana]|uniref:Formylglycine-generating enzyme, required for sulfatase activity, contains SUMF1/FGE domain n=1 Tax=Alkalispirochaeta americana TaxID=159291 RepID=A0A1N6YCE0_9SPIO|nr:SUMF1/EgtB/PvdO family nonheme iron enzyme [Alkalispirochaeta americana]SIR12213.1 Formylglycine-generating enzyme, required for sulfatase activity, contains SUMF1/FGE domain [Alkalispirochaeta americana]
MKNLKVIAMLLAVTALVFTAYDDLSGSEQGPGEPIVETVGGVRFQLNLANDRDSVTFPTGVDDDGIATLNHKFYMGDTQVTYELWKVVYDWATDARARGNAVYTFANRGRMGSHTEYEFTDQHPVTDVSWRDAIIWCNALSEMTGLEPVYRDRNDTNVILRDSTVAIQNLVEEEEETIYRKGYRLPTSMEWEMAARYRGTDRTNTVTGVVGGVNFGRERIKWTKGNSASGDTGEARAGSSTLGNYAWFPETVRDRYPARVNTSQPVSKSDPVDGRRPNALGLYDMSGNVDEWCFTSSGTSRVLRGGRWGGSPILLRVGHVSVAGPSINSGMRGFRLAKTK